jgi:hypothetical protein
MAEWKDQPMVLPSVVSRDKPSVATKESLMDSLLVGMTALKLAQMMGNLKVV